LWLAGLYPAFFIPSVKAEPVQPPVNPSSASAVLAQGIVQITGVQINTVDGRLELNLSTSGALAEPATSFNGNALIIRLTGAVLALEEDEFLQFEPAEGIALVQVSQLPNNEVQVAVTGTDAPPTVSTFVRAETLTLSLEPGTAIASTEDEALRILVTNDQDEGYNPTSSSVATDTETPLLEVPFSVQVIPREVLEDRNVTEVGDALETAGGVADAGGRGRSEIGPNFLIRGLPVSDGIFRDGIPTFSLSALSTNDIERIEVLRGPASVLFGQGDPGGIINLVTKRPLAEPFYSVSATAGSFSTYRGAVDLSGPLSAEGTVRYRLNVSYENAGSFRDFVNRERFLISPIVTWDIGPRTSLDIYGQYVYDEETIDGGIPAIGDRVADVPRSRFLGEDFAEFTQDQFSVGYRLNHEFSQNWSARHSLQYLTYEPRRYVPLTSIFNPNAFNEATGELQRFEYFGGGSYNRLFTNAETIGQFNTGSVEHQVLFGVEYRRNAETPEFQIGDPYPSINIFNPVYAGVRYDIEPTFFRDNVTNTVGVYVQDQIEIVPELTLLAGIRYDFVDQLWAVESQGSPREEFNTTDEAFTPRLGVVYQPIEPLSLYASYTTSFNPANGDDRNPDGSTFDPETGRQFEVGLKADLSDRLSLNLAAFDIRRQNIQTPDPNNPFVSRQTGEVTSRGIEAYLGGEILPGWNITAAYTYLDAFVSEDTRDIVGNRLPNVPENQFSLWTTYEIQQGDLAGLGVGLGLFYVGDRQGDQDNTVTLPSYLRTDAALFYRRNNWRAQLNFENLFDVEYFSSATFNSRLLNNPGAPFGVSASVSVEF
ncbi:MAG: TonB-dependent siderophore receptor, partial [Cyanobacteria bacterium P01_C01_bin.120]